MPRRVLTIERRSHSDGPILVRLKAELKKYEWPATSYSSALAYRCAVAGASPTAGRPRRTIRNIARPKPTQTRV